MPTFEEQIKFLHNNVPDSKRLVFLAGAGISVSAGYPLWGPATAAALQSARERGLISAGASAYADEKLGRSQYYDVFDILQRELPETAFYRIAMDVFGKNLPPSEVHKLLVRIPCRGIITTNFDECLPAACAIERGGMPINEIPVAMASDRFFVLKPHGSILNPKSMVLTTQDWRRVETNGDLKELLAQAISDYQLIFIGYGFRDPDFEHIWSQLLIERIFRMPAIYCCREGAVPPAQIEEFRTRNVQLLEFTDDGSFEFVPKVLRELAAYGTATCPVVTATPPELAAQELEKYVFLCMQFSPTRQDRLVLVAKAIALDVFSNLNKGAVTRASFLEQLCETLGQDSALIRRSGEIALGELEEEGLLAVDGDLFRPNPEKLHVLASEAEKLEKAEGDWVGRALREQTKHMGLEVEAGDQANVLRVLDRALLEVGRDLAELFLFNRPPKDESARIDDSVDEVCRNSDFSGRRELYRRVVKRLLFEPEESEEDLLFKKLQAYFISTAYVLNPTSERLLAQYARNHWVYFDSSIILPALALGHPSNPVYKRLLRRTQALGMRVMIIQDMLNEVWANVRTAISAFSELKRVPTSLHDALGAYVTMHGPGNGNVFLEGFLIQLHLDPSLTPEAYMSAVLGSGGFQISESHVMKAVSETYGIESDALKDREIDRSKLEPIIDSIEHLRKFGGRFKNRMLCEHEAHQFYLIHLRREQNPELATKIWYVTTDRFVTELQRLEREKFPLPISYTPRNWFQYLDLIDFESRGSRHFSRLQPLMRFGVVSGEIGIEAIRLMVQEQKQLLEKGAVTLKEMAEAAVRDYHVQQAIAEVDQRAGPDRQAEARDRVRQTISKAAGHFVAIRAQELEELKQQARKEREERQKLEKQLAKQKYISSTLKAQQKPTKKRNKRRR